jgi:hypothetical protein
MILRVLSISIFAVIFGSLRLPTALAAPPPPAAQRGFKIVVAGDAPEAVRRAAQQVLQAAKEPDSPALLKVLSGSSAPQELTDSKVLISAKAPERAYNHLLLIGLPDDPMISAAWQHEARLENGVFTIFGWGHLRGDIGYLESDRNPFLHGAGIPAAPFETEVITLTGSTPAGVALAVDAFLRRGLVNGVVAAPGWTRPTTTLLDQDPLAANTIPDSIPAIAGDAVFIGLTQGGEDESRGVLEDTSILPAEIWRAKYFLPGVWDGKGAEAAFDAYSNGLHRRAYGNTLWMANFASSTEAAQAAPKIAAAARLGRAGAFWVGQQPAYAGNGYVGEKTIPGPIRLWQQDNRVMMSTLPSAETDALAARLQQNP